MILLDLVPGGSLVVACGSLNPMGYNQRTLEKLTEPGTYWDPATPGLVLRIRESGAKSWYFVYRLGGRAARKQWLKLADFGVEGMPGAYPMDGSTGHSESHLAE